MAHTPDGFEAIEKARSGNPPEKTEAIERAMRWMDDPDNIRRLDEAHNKWRPRLVGKVIRVLTPLDPKAGFGMKTWWG